MVIGYEIFMALYLGSTPLLFGGFESMDDCAESAKNAIASEAGLSGSGKPNLKAACIEAPRRDAGIGAINISPSITFQGTSQGGSND